MFENKRETQQKEQDQFDEVRTEREVHLSTCSLGLVVDRKRLKKPNKKGESRPGLLAFLDVECGVLVHMVRTGKRGSWICYETRW